jgi:MoxR-like ATPase
MYKAGKVDVPLNEELPPPAPLGSSATAYQASTELAEAVNVSITLGHPLLVTGEPGCGKTQLAASVAWQLGLGEFFRFDTKSTSTARDLFYTFNALGRFYDAQVLQFAEPEKRKLLETRDYIKIQALGSAILHANPGSEAAQRVQPSVTGQPQRRSVVLIDEIDKAPRDFPNDLLHEIESMSFRIHELDNLELSAPMEMRPIVIITSNSEKNLPEPFLRRCVYHHIAFPDDDLERIILGHLPDLANEPDWITDVLSVFRCLRTDASALEKKPATAELLSWIIALRQLGAERKRPLAEQLDLVDATSGVLVKTMADRKRIRELVRSCLKPA